ncbi:hypothetical protein HUU39_22245 [candidate division KSB1 bacterium]|nr:hypothetical protein [bacterium]NUM67956.1 hypothetical protein [candidate division KSB1 bacterium]
MLRTSLKTGLEQLHANWRMVLVYYLSSLVFGLILTLPMWTSLRRFIGASEMGALLAGRLDWDFAIEFLHNNPSLLPTLQRLLVLMFLLHTLWSLFLSGGAFAIFAAGRRYEPAVFWSGAAKYFGRFLRLSAWSLLPAFALLLLLFLPGLLKRVIFGSDPYENVGYWMGWVTVGWSYVCLLFFKLVFDYARIHVVMAEDRQMRFALAEGLRFVLRNFARAFALSLLFFCTGLLVLAIYNPLADSLAAPSALVIFLLFVLQQAYLFWRKALGLALDASQVQLYRESQRAAHEEPQPANELGWEGAWA